MPKHVRSVSYEELSEKYEITECGKIIYRHDVICGNGRVVKRKGDIAGSTKGKSGTDGGRVQIKGTGFSMARAAYMLHNKCDIPAYYFVMFKNGDSLDFSSQNLYLENPAKHSRANTPKQLPKGVFIIKPRNWMLDSTIRYSARMKVIHQGHKKRIYGPYRHSIKEAENDYAKMLNRYTVEAPPQVCA